MIMLDISRLRIVDNNEQQEEAQKAMIVGVPENKILEYFYPDVEVEEMRQVRENFEKASA
jgi:type IV secretion system protein VirD4